MNKLATRRLAGLHRQLSTRMEMPLLAVATLALWSNGKLISRVVVLVLG